jgi:hypothetical protein
MALFARGDMATYTPLVGKGGPETVRVLSPIPAGYLVHGVEDPFFAHPFNAVMAELVADATKTAIQHHLRPLPR